MSNNGPLGQPSRSSLRALAEVSGAGYSNDCTCKAQLAECLSHCGGSDSKRPPSHENQHSRFLANIPHAEASLPGLCKTHEQEAQLQLYSESPKKAVTLPAEAASSLMAA